jgi:hypothetical protein
VNTETTQLLVPSEATATTFTLDNARPWPVGQYRLVIAVDGHEQQSRTFDVR